MKENRKYTYNEIYHSIKKISDLLNSFNHNDIEKSFVDYLIFITIFKHINHVLQEILKKKAENESDINFIDTILEKISNKEKTASKNFNFVTLNLIKVSFSKNKLSLDNSKNKEIYNSLLSTIYLNYENYFDDLKPFLFTKKTKVNLDEINFELSSIINIYTDKIFSSNEYSDENYKVSYFEFSTDIIRIISVKKIDDLIDIYMNINKSNKNKYYITQSFKSQILPYFLHKHLDSNQNLVCFGLSPHSSLESYIQSSRLSNKKINLTKSKIYFSGKKSTESYYQLIHYLILNLKSIYFEINTYTNKIGEEKDTLVIGIYDNEDKDDAIEFLYTSIFACTKKCFLLLPYSTLSIKVKKFSELNEDFENEVYIDTIELIKQHRELVETQYIQKVLALPNNYFFHTKEPLVLLELSKKPVDGIHFIDLNNLEKPMQSGNSSLFKTQELKEITQWYQQKDLTIKGKILSKYVPYKDILNENIHNYNLLVNHHLIQTNKISSAKKLSTFFEIKKIQRFNYFKGNTPMKVYSISEFKDFSFTKNNDISKTINFSAPFYKDIKEIIKSEERGELSKSRVISEQEKKVIEEKKRYLKEYRKFQKSHQLIDYDILLYVYDSSKVTILSDTKPYSIGTHNLLRIRLKEEFNSKIPYSQVKEIIIKIKKGLKAEKQKVSKYRVKKVIKKEFKSKATFTQVKKVILKIKKYSKTRRKQILKSEVKQILAVDNYKFQKLLYLFLLSTDGQKSLKKILDKSKDGKDVISIKKLNDLEIDFSQINEKTKEFNKIQQYQEKINSIKKDILSILK